MPPTSLAAKSDVPSIHATHDTVNGVLNTRDAAWGMLGGTAAREEENAGQEKGAGGQVGWVIS